MWVCVRLLARDRMRRYLECHVLFSRVAVLFQYSLVWLRVCSVV